MALGAVADDNRVPALIAEFSQGEQKTFEIRILVEAARVDDVRSLDHLRVSDGVQVDAIRNHEHVVGVRAQFPNARLHGLRGVTTSSGVCAAIQRLFEAVTVAAGGALYQSTTSGARASLLAVFTTNTCFGIAVA